jgi:hypothetical protein
VRGLGAEELGITAVSNANLLSGRQLEALTQQTGLPYSSLNPSVFWRTLIFLKCEETMNWRLVVCSHHRGGNSDDVNLTAGMQP